jgi:glycerophosphoryl diester phosphodiesterase
MEFIFILVTLFFIYFLMIRIDSFRIRKLAFMHIPVAHRGLYAADQSIPENSLAAFQNAVDHGYAIEFDVQCSVDGAAFVFHDADLLRMCGRLDVLKAMEADEIHKMKLKETDQHIPYLRDVLALVAGKIPLWIEIKTTERRRETVDIVMELLHDYPGEYSICSFDPLILLELKRRYPHVIRGIIVESYVKKNDIPWYIAILLLFSLLNFLTRPDYQSFDIAQRHHPTYGFNRLLGAHSIFWVVRSQAEEEKIRKSCDNFVFEHYLPVLNRNP